MSLTDVHQALLPRAPLLKLEDIEKAFGDWEVSPVLGGAILVKGNEIHVAVKPESRGRWLSRRLVKAFPGRLIDQYGLAVTSVMEDNETGINFVERLGFKRTGKEKGKVSYELRKLRF